MRHTPKAARKKREAAGPSAPQATRNPPHTHTPEGARTPKAVGATETLRKQKKANNLKDRTPKRSDALRPSKRFVIASGFPRSNLGHARQMWGNSGNSLTCLDPQNTLNSGKQGVHESKRKSTPRRKQTGPSDLRQNASSVFRGSFAT